MFNHKNGWRAAIAVSLLMLWGFVHSLLHWSPRLPPQRPGVAERLQRMAPDTKEETRRYLYLDNKDRRLEVVFTDGCVGLRTKDENGNITLVAERKKDGSLLAYLLNDKLQIKRITLVDKHGKLFSIDTVTSADSYRREWYWPDGKTLHGVLEVSPDREVFSVYDEKGVKRYDDIEEKTQGQYDDPEAQYYGGYYGGYGRPQTTTTIIVYNGSAMPKYKLTVGQPTGQQPEVEIESVDEYEPGSTTVARRITPQVVETIGSKLRTLKKVEVFSNGEVRYIRFLDDKNRIVRMVEKRTGEPDVTTDVTDADIANAAVEPLDPAMFLSPETPADIKLAEGMMAGNADMHLERLLVP